MIREVQMLQLSFSVELMEECKTSLLAFECLRGLQHAYLSPAVGDGSRMQYSETCSSWLENRLRSR